MVLRKRRRHLKCSIALHCILQQRLGPHIRQSLTIESVAQYSSLRECAQYCVYGGPPNGSPGLPVYLGCWNPALNDCFCRADLSASATNFLSTCVNQWCSGDAADISSAVGVYETYCTGVEAVPTGTAQSTAAPGSSSGKYDFNLSLHSFHPSSRIMSMRGSNRVKTSYRTCHDD
jgi:hypothetical protein